MRWLWTYRYGWPCKIKENDEGINLEKIEKNKNEQTGRKWYTVAGAIVVFSLLIVVMIYAIFCFVFPSTKVVGVSMKPSLNNYVDLVDGKDDSFYEESIFQDTIFVNRFNKGGVGDIVVLNKDGKNVVKRIIATSNQTLSLKKEADGYYYFYRDGEKLEEEYINDRSAMNITYYGKFLATYGSDTIKIKDGCVFVLGDNRGYSYDCASYDYKIYTKDTIVGTVAIQLDYEDNIISWLWRNFWGLFGLEEQPV